MAIINSVDEAFAYVKGLLETAQKRANDTFPKIQKLNEIKQAPIVNVSTTNAFTFDSYYERNKPFTTAEQVDKKLADYQMMLEANLQTIEQVHTTNIPLMENNRVVKEKITVVMQQIGIPSNYTTSEFKTNRSRTKTTTTHAAGYIGDLSRNCLVDDNYTYRIKQAKDAFGGLKRKADQEKQRIRQEQQAKEQEEKKKKSVQALARMQIKYGLNEHSMWEDVLEALDNKDKYFMLARAMEDTRGDWSEGFGRVEWAISRFVVESPEDKEIEENISTFLDGEYEDGRCFRDCEWNYSVLYGKVDGEILRDYETLQEYYSKY